MEFSVTYGKQTFRTSGAKLFAFVLKENEGRGRVRYDVRRKEFCGNMFDATGTTLSEYASRANIEERGMWYTGTYQGKENALVMLQARYTVNSGPYLDAAMFLLLRSGAPLIKIDARLPTNADARFSQRIAFNGRAHALTAEEVKDMGIAMSTQFQRTFLDEEQIEEAYALIGLAPGREGSLQIESVEVPGTDTVKTAIHSAPRRRLRLRRGRN